MAHHGAQIRTRTSRLRPSCGPAPAPLDFRPSAPDDTGPYRPSYLSVNEGPARHLQPLGTNHRPLIAREILSNEPRPYTKTRGYDGDPIEDIWCWSVEALRGSPGARSRLRAFEDGSR